MFVEFKEIGLLCEDDVMLELDKYLNILEDESQRIKIEKMIRHRLLTIGSEFIHRDDRDEYKYLLTGMRFKKCSVDYYELQKDKILRIIERCKVKNIFDRTAVMSSLIWTLGVTAKLTCTEAVCECAINIFKQSDYQNLIKYDKNLLMNIDSYNIQMASLILKFRFSESFMKYHSGCTALLRPEVLTDVFFRIKEIYPDENDSRVFECLMFYSCPLTKHPKDDDYRIVMACRILFKNNLNFIDLTLKILRAAQTTMKLKALFAYAKQIDSLHSKYGKNWEDIFNSKIPSITNLENLMTTLADSANFSKPK